MSMSRSCDEAACPKFQPNIFDPSRCHDCLRQRHLHSGTGGSGEAAPQQKSTAQPKNEAKTVTDDGAGRGKGLVLTPSPSQTEEQDTSSKEDSDGLSAVSSYCDVNGSCAGYQESSLCILSPDCELYVCYGDDDGSTDSCRGQSDYQEFSGSGSTEDEYVPIHPPLTRVDMTRLEHRSIPEAWLDETQSKDSFSRSGLTEDRQKRESGYFSLGRAAGANLLRNNSLPAPFRHYERGHPIYSNRNVKPKDTIPFRNPNLGVASERQKTNTLNGDLSADISSPDPYETAIEVEAQVGPRSPSPTPFKIAESLASTDRKGFNSSHGRGSPSSHSSFQQSGHFDSLRYGSTLQFRSSSPSCGNIFRRSESTGSLNRHSFDDGGWSHGMTQRSRNSLQASHGRLLGSGTLPRNFKSFANSVKSQSSAVSDFRCALRKTEVSRSLRGWGQDSRQSMPLRRDYNTSGQMSLQNTEITSSSPNGHGHDSRASSPTWRTSLHDSFSPARRSNSSYRQSLLRKSESVLSLSEQGHRRHCGSPIREGYDIESQALLRNQTAKNGAIDQEDQGLTISPPRQRYGTSHPVLSKTESNHTGDRQDCYSQSSSPGRRSFDTSAQYQLRKTKTNSSLHGRSAESHNSPWRRGYEAPSQSLLHRSQVNHSVRSHDSYNSMPSRKNYDTPDQSSQHKRETNCSPSIKSHSSHMSSNSRKGHSDPPGYSILRNATNRDSSHSPQRKNNDQSSSSWWASGHPLCSSSLSHTASPSKLATNGTSTSVVTLQAQKSPRSSRSGASRQSCKERSQSPKDNRLSHHTRTSSLSPHIQMQRHTSSQSSMESSESSQQPLVSSRRGRKEYAVTADVPKVKMSHQRNGPGDMRRPQNQRPSQKQELFKPASHSLSKHPSREWEDTGDAERDWQCGGSVCLSGAHSSTLVERPDSPKADQGSSWKCHHHRSEQMEPDLLNFKKGWMSKLDDSGEWKKHWFVLSDAGLKYYRDSSAEEKDDLDGEIDLKSCVKVSEYDVEKNYGFQIQTREAAFTLSAMTAGIRRNWIEVLKKCIRPSSTPDLTQLPDKENSHSRVVLSSHRTSSRQADVQSDAHTSAPPTLRRFDYVELSPVSASSGSLPASQRQPGEGQGKEHRQWQEEKNMSSQWEALLSRKGTGVGSNQRLPVEDEIEKKWVEFESMPVKEMSSRPPVDFWTSSHSANEALQREVASLRQQLEELQGGRGQGGGGGRKDVSVRAGCGPEASCNRGLAAMEHAHRQAMEELQRQHERQMKELENEKNRLLLEETQDTARVIEALTKRHEEELEQEVEKVRRLSSGFIDSQTMRVQHLAESQTIQRELAGLSERYSQKCLELSLAEQNNVEREQEICQKERDMEQLRKENQNLKARLKEEMIRVQSAITDQRSEDSRARCELEVLVRIKENEIEYLHKEISCLRNELQFLNTEKRLACERYIKINEELSGMKGRTEREIQSLKEHLKLAMAALQEGQKLGNSLDH